MTAFLRAALAALLLAAPACLAADPAADKPQADLASAEAEAALLGSSAPVPALSTLRHAVVCPPFKGDADIAAIYRNALLEMLRGSPRIELLEGPRALASRAPAFTYRITGEVFREGEHDFIALQLTDAARRELIASFVSPASHNPSALNQWKRVVRADMQRRVDAMPFECRILRKQGQDSITLDRGLGSGLRPGMVLQAVVAEEPLISPFTGEEFGRDTPAPFGSVRVFRVNEDSAYARPLPGISVPRKGTLYAREF